MPGVAGYGQSSYLQPNFISVLFLMVNKLNALIFALA